MKKTSFLCIIAMIITFCCTEANAQRHIYRNYTINFDDAVSDTCVLYYADTIHNPSNVWQIGHSHKPGLQGTGNVLMTDTLNPYPANDTSYFLIKIWNHGLDIAQDYGDVFEMFFTINSKSDTIKDILVMDFSYNNERTWINLNTDENFQCWEQWDTTPVSGLFSGYKHLYLVPPSSEGNLCIPGADTMSSDSFSDTIALRFGFQTDSIMNRTEGVLIESIFIGEFITTSFSEIIGDRTVSIIEKISGGVSLKSSIDGWLKVYSMTGSLVVMQKIRQGINHIPFEPANDGMYLFYLIDNDGVILNTSKVILFN